MTRSTSGSYNRSKPCNAREAASIISIGELKIENGNERKKIKLKRPTKRYSVHVYFGFAKLRVSRKRRRRGREGEERRDEERMQRNVRAGEKRAIETETETETTVWKADENEGEEAGGERERGEEPTAILCFMCKK